MKRVVLCAGQVYYDLEAGRAERKLEDDIAIVRVEQLYPFPYDEVKAELAKYPNAKSVVWAQEEPKNQGAFYQIRHRIEGRYQRRAKTVLMPVVQAAHRLQWATQANISLN